MRFGPFWAPRPPPDADDDDKNNNNNNPASRPDPLPRRGWHNPFGSPHSDFE